MRFDILIRLANFAAYLAIGIAPVWVGGGTGILVDARVQVFALVSLGWAILEASLKPEQFARRWFDVAWVALALFGVASGIAVAMFEYRFLAGAFSREAWLMWLGVGMAGLGLATRYAAIRTLGNFFSHELKVVSDQRLVQTGVYRYLRHPSYTGYGLILLGLPLILCSWLGFLAMLAYAAAGFVIRIGWEEHLLVQHFGDDYRVYQKKTKRLIPFVW